MDIREFSNKFAEATKNMSPAERAALLKMFEGVSSEITKSDAPSTCRVCPPTSDGSIPNGMTERLRKLKDNYMKQRPAISIQAALTKTKVMKENPGLPRIELRAKAFRECCETAPLVIQDNELIVGNPTGGPRVGCFSPDIAWRWLREELDTVATRPQDPFYISEEDKKTCREVLFPFWEGKSVDEYCETQYRECGGWELSGESFVSDCSYHATSGGGDSNPGYDVILMKNFDLISIIAALFAVMVVYNVANGSFHLGFSGQPIAHSQHLWNILGMYVVGFAAVLAGGCPLRQLILAGSGNGDSTVTVFGMLAGAAAAHNFGLAGTADSTNAAGEFVRGGLSNTGKIAVVSGIVVCLAVSVLNLPKFVKKQEAK